MNDFLWWSGAIGWGFLGVCGLFELGGMAIDRIVDGLGVKKEFLAFAWDRMKRRSSPSIPG